MIAVLRIGHRPDRDKRITTHVALVARAFGAGQVLIDEKDSELEDNLKGVCDKFGGPFDVVTGVKWRNVLDDWPGQTVHLTMYGEEIEKGIDKLSPDKDILIVVGAEKVPREVYDKADYNISVGNQPHSEVAALAVFLYRLFEGDPFKDFEGGQMRILPCERGKNVEER
ncbi:MAG: tRNA 2'-O-methylase [Candidatus Proteinoplasmatales archaeon SG8-5]|nr:MAG: tRNA 2'-O-methylase [Candidatus Proteinoplasmatales archaeon SG8-5]